MASQQALGSFIPPCSACGMTSLFSGNAQIGKSGIFRALFPSQVCTQLCGDAVLPFPAHSDMGPGQCVPGFSTAPPCTICRIPSNLGIPLPSLQLWPCTVIPHFWYGSMQECTTPFWWLGLSFPRLQMQQNLGVARGCSTFLKYCTGGIREGSYFTTRVYVQ